MAYNPDNIIAFRWSDNDYNSPVRMFLQLIVDSGHVHGNTEYWAEVWNSTIPGLHLLDRQHFTYSMDNLERVRKYLTITPGQVFLGEDAVAVLSGPYTFCSVDFRLSNIEPIFILAD